EIGPYEAAARDHVQRHQVELALLDALGLRMDVARQRLQRDSFGNRMRYQEGAQELAERGLRSGRQLMPDIDDGCDRYFLAPPRVEALRELGRQCGQQHGEQQIVERDAPGLRGAP